MFLLLLGVPMLVMYLMKIEPVASWPWWTIALPFAGTVLWWMFADSTGLTKRVAMRRMEDRTAARRERNLDALGMRAGKGSRPARPTARHVVKAVDPTLMAHDRDSRH